VNFSKFAKKHALGDLENKMLNRSSMLQEQIDHIIEFQNHSEKMLIEAKNEISLKIQEITDPIS
jgi:hypothetical protein